MMWCHIASQVTVQWTSPRWPGDTACPPSPSLPWTRPSSLCWRWPPSWALKSSTTEVKRMCLAPLSLTCCRVKNDWGKTYSCQLTWPEIVSVATWLLQFADISSCACWDIEVSHLSYRTWQHLNPHCLQLDTSVNHPCPRATVSHILTVRYG